MSDLRDTDARIEAIARMMIQSDCGAIPIVADIAVHASKRKAGELLREVSQPVGL